MARKNILSQMFDVRPRDERGDLDVERVQKIRELLDLAGKSNSAINSQKDFDSGRTINLKGRIIQTIVAQAPPKKRKKLIQAFSDEQVLKSLLAGGGNLESENASQPSREEILAVLSQIEELDQYLEANGLGKDEVGERVNSEELEEKLSEEMASAQAENLFILEEFLAPAKSDIILVESEKPEIVAVENSELLDFERPVRDQEAEIFSLDALLIQNSSSKEEIIVLSKTQEQYFRVLTETEIWSRLLHFINSVKEYFKNRKILGQQKERLVFVQNIIPISYWRRGAWFVGAGLFIWLFVFGLSIAGRGLSAKSSILDSSLQAYQAMQAGQNSASNLDFSAAQVNFSTAYENFLQAEQELNGMGKIVVGALEQLPGGSKIKSGGALIEAGKNLAQAGTSFSNIGAALSLDKFGDYFFGNDSLTQKISEVQGELKNAQDELVLANKNLAAVKTNDLSADMAPSIESLKEKLPIAIGAVNELNRWANVFLEIFGQDQAKKYLLVFQNTAEARPTGGFIGSYGVLDLDQGKIKDLFVDNVFDLDGQLYEKVVPPRPIQKISTAWSLHDANWFADWPTSAQKILWFYEQTGGATADGVISLTPAVVEKLLALTGPIAMPKYGITFSQDNFVDLLQQKVEIDYDKLENQPKKILADFAPKFLYKLWDVWPQKYNEIFQIISDSLAQKDILFYFSNPDLQKTFVEQGWAGEILSTDKDYLSVINTNINGFKTDKVIEQKIEHNSQVQNDGTIVDTVKITRTHTGGKSQYDWYNKVNTDYLRVYVPQGSQLISAQGTTLEAYKAPADYQKMNFKTDADVVAEEQDMSIDPNSGTQIFSESGKTVFGNWIYVSPGETVEITYKYLLPFKLNLNADNFSWSLLVQKQSGSTGSQFESTLQLPQEFKISWQYPDNLQISGSQIKFSGDLKKDEFYGVVFEK